ncbi:MAG TPA: histidine phosphatase family protein [Anaerolineales bacterium]|nr:histidine phosphatase family protein [Anaerolineales bacterium]
MNHLILVKHSLPEIVPSIPAQQWVLSKAGQVRCTTLAARIESHFPDIVISSVEPKAVQTAQLLAGPINKPFRIWEGLHEHDRTGVEFMGHEQFESKVRDFFKHPDKLIIGKETAVQACERFSNALSSIEIEYLNKNIVVVSHGTVITLFVEKMTGLKSFSFWKNLDLPSFVVFSLPGHELLTIVESIV